MHRSKRLVKDTRDSDFEYANMIKSSKPFKNSEDLSAAALDISSRATGGMESSPAPFLLTSTSASPSNAVLQRSISQIESKIKELEIATARSIRAPTKPADSMAPGPSLGDILQSTLTEDPVGKRTPIYNIAHSPNMATAGAAPSVPVSSSKNLKSGYELKVQEEVRQIVLWPHGFLSKLQNITDIRPEHLQLDAFMYGYASILLQAKDTLEISGRLQHLQQVMWHSILHDWKSARDFHYQVMRELEMGNITWQDQHEMLMLSLSAAHEKQAAKPSRAVFSSKASKFNVEDSSDKSICCYLYNSEEKGCRFEKSAEGCKKLHACARCAAKGFYNRHSALECKK